VLTDILSSLTLLLIDGQTGRVTYSGAGDLPLLHYKAGIDKLLTVSSSGLLLGLFADGSYSEQEIALNEGDKLFAFTDGMIDFANATGKKSDYNSFAAQLSQWVQNGDGFAKIKAGLEKGQGSQQIDDQSIISIFKIGA